MGRRLRLLALAALPALAACAGDEPVPFPTFADAGLERECACVTEGRCWVVELADGEGEERGFQCRWADERAGRAICRWEHRFKPTGEAWSEWEKSEVPFRHLGGRSWCWDRQGSEGHP